MSELKKDVTRKKIHENETLNKIVDIVEKIPDLNKKQKAKGLPSDLDKHIKILTPKQMLQRLSLSIAQGKAGNTFEHLLNEIKQIIYSLH